SRSCCASRRSPRRRGWRRRARAGTVPSGHPVTPSDPVQFLWLLSLAAIVVVARRRARGGSLATAPASVLATIRFGASSSGWMMSPLQLHGSRHLRRRSILCSREIGKDGSDAYRQSGAADQEHIRPAPPFFDRASADVGGLACR